MQDVMFEVPITRLLFNRVKIFIFHELGQAQVPGITGGSVQSRDDQGIGKWPCDSVGNAVDSDQDEASGESGMTDTFLRRLRLPIKMTTKTLLRSDPGFYD
jgi:hypothetical protein